MTKKLIFVFLLGGMLTVAKADQVRLDGRATNGDVAWNVNANGNDTWHSSVTFDRGFVEVTDGTTTEYNHAIQDLGTDHVTGDWMRTTNSGDHGDPFDFHWNDWGSGNTHFDWGHHGNRGGQNGSGLSGSGSTGAVATPEPGTVFLLGAGLLGFALLKLRK